MRISLPHPHLSCQWNLWMLSGWLMVPLLLVYIYPDQAEVYNYEICYSEFSLRSKRIDDRYIH